MAAAAVRSANGGLPFLGSALNPGLLLSADTWNLPTPVWGWEGLLSPTQVWGISADGLHSASQNHRGHEEKPLGSVTAAALHPHTANMDRRPLCAKLPILRNPQELHIFETSPTLSGLAEVCMWLLEQRTVYRSLSKTSQLWDGQRQSTR
ncbi:hypothetical protein AV530_003516 [Patagioenas fasciata monilis]|uniref:Uncharacterized protein n=1 Tax=Patagioenas fasciata monilis TaxID=372326 RepID=A0A1V4K4E2_PATFA|nr:hypothetical protein AV530_003516 [Patagioenas fasciata monilis]